MCLFLVLNSLDVYRIELGASDDAFLSGNEASWGRAYRDSGPFRVRRGERRMTYFAARMAFPGAGIRLPAFVSGGAGEVRLRAHRYGQPGIVHVFGNGIRLGRIVFHNDTYPWEVFRFEVPETIFRPEALTLELLGEALEGRDKLPPEALLALDWVELHAGSSGELRLSRHVTLLALALPAGLLLVLLWAGASPGWSAAATGLMTSVELWALSSAPGPTSGALEHLPVIFPLILLLYLVLRWGVSCRPRRARALSAAFGFVLLAHATVIFFPDHQPPDLGPHLGQIRKLNDKRFDRGQFWEFSSAFGKDGRGKPHFGADYEAPYPPWTYFIVHGLRRLLDHPRFWLELVGMVAGALLALLAYALASALARDERAPWLAFVLMALEIATWHHASRVHTPGLVGQVFFVAALTYLLFGYESLGRLRGFAIFALLSLTATLAYTATLFHVVAFMVCFTGLELVESRSALPSRMTARAVAASVVGTLGSFAIFYHRFVPAALASRSAILAEEGYRPPATFFLLRNQMRDTATILSFGYPLFVLLALPAYFRLRDWTSGPLARRMILAWTASYVILLVLKDPIFFPQLLLHVKEELMFAPAMCVLGAMTLAWISRRGRVGAGIVVAVLVLFLGLQARDYRYNADTIAVWAETQR